MESRGRLEYDEDDEGDIDVILHAKDLQNLSSSITKLEYLYKTQIYNALRSDGADIDIDTGGGVVNSHSAENNLTYEQVCQLPYSTLVKALSTPTSNYKSTSDNKETTDYNLLEGYYAWFDHDLHKGSMPNRGTVSVTLKPEDSLNIADGFHTGLGNVDVTVSGGTALVSNVLEGSTFYAGDDVALKTGTIPRRTDYILDLTGSTFSASVPAGYYAEDITAIRDDTSEIDAALRVKGVTGDAVMSNATIADKIRQIQQSITVNNIVATTLEYRYHWHDKNSTTRAEWNDDSSPTNNRENSFVAQGCWGKPVYHAHSSSTKTDESYSANSGPTTMQVQGPGSCFETENRHTHDNCHKKHTGTSGTTSPNGCYQNASTATLSCDGRITHTHQKIPKKDGTTTDKEACCTWCSKPQNHRRTDEYVDGLLAGEEYDKNCGKTGRDYCGERYTATVYTLSCLLSECGYDQNQLLGYDLSCTVSQSTPIAHELNCGWAANQITEAHLVFPSSN